MDAFELLKKDHQKVSQLFSEIESASGQAKFRLFGQLKSELDLHAHIEETILYPALENTDEAREITLEAYEEHNVVKDLLSDLASATAPNDEWDAKLTVLKENVEHHVEEEEGELFDKARKALGEERIETLGAELEAEKAKQTGAKPRATAKPRKAASKGAQKESPGVLQRLASFIGLAEPAPQETGKTSAKAGKKSGTKSSAAKSGKPKTAASPSVKASGASKSAKASAKVAAKPAKATSKKAAKKSAGKARTSARAIPAKKATTSRARTSASKSAARPASNQKVGRGRKAAKSSTKSSTGTRRKSR